jgi:hypothetical protein
VREEELRGGRRTALQRFAWGCPCLRRGKVGFGCWGRKGRSDFNRGTQETIPNGVYDRSPAQIAHPLATQASCSIGLRNRIIIKGLGLPLPPLPALGSNEQRQTVLKIGGK